MADLKRKMSFVDFPLESNTLYPAAYGAITGSAASMGYLIATMEEPEGRYSPEKELYKRVKKFLTFIAEVEEEVDTFNKETAEASRELNKSLEQRVSQ